MVGNGIFSVRALFSSVTWLGTPIFYIPLIVYLIGKDFPTARKLVISLLIVEALSGGIKLAYQKPRPIKMIARNFFDRYNANSFPSIHSARTIAVFFILAVNSRNSLLWLTSAILAVAVGYSRIYLKKHHIEDVIGGFVIGIIISVLVLIVLN